MNIALTTHGEELLRAALDRHPGQLPEEIVEQALTERIKTEQLPAPSGAVPPKRTPEEIAAFFEALAADSEKIPALPTAAFSRESIYQDHT